MKTVKTVVDEKKLTNEELGCLYRKTNEMIRRINNGSLTYNDVVLGMQDVIEGKTKKLKWYEKNEIIYFKVASDGTNGEQWIERLTKQGFEISEGAKESLLSKDFKYTTHATYEIAILKGCALFSKNVITETIAGKAKQLKLQTPNPEVACLIRERFSDEEISDMGLSWIAIFHNPIRHSEGDLSFLTADSRSSNCFGCTYGESYNHWSYGFGAAFIVSDLIDTEADPFIPEGFRIEKHHQKGLTTFNFSTCSLYLSSKQIKGVINGNDLIKELENKPVMNANVLDYFLEHPELIPENYKGKCIFFWGTIYSNDDGLYVCCLYWNGSNWKRHYECLDHEFSHNEPAIIES